MYKKIAQRILEVRAVSEYFFLNVITIILLKIARIIGREYTSIWYNLKNSWFDHRFDYLRGIDNFFWYERGLFANLIINEGDNVLDIGSGDGIYSGLFFSKRAKHVDAVDSDLNAINHSKNHYQKFNIGFHHLNVLKNEFPERKYDKIFLFSVIEHFTDTEGHMVLNKVAKSLASNGVFMGSTPIFKQKGKHNEEHKNEFTSISQLKRFLNPHFRKIKIFTSKWGQERIDCYFECNEPILINKINA